MNPVYSVCTFDTRSDITVFKEQYRPVTLLRNIIFECNILLQMVECNVVCIDKTMI